MNASKKYSPLLIVAFALAVLLVIFVWAGGKGSPRRMATETTQASVPSPAPAVENSVPVPALARPQPEPPAAAPASRMAPPLRSTVASAPATVVTIPENASELSPFERYARDNPVKVVPLVPPPPAGREELRIRLADKADPEAAKQFAATLQGKTGVDLARFDPASNELVVTEMPGTFDAHTLSEQAANDGLEVRGQVLNLHLNLSSHARTCGSCGYQVFQQLAKEPGVEAVEVFVPVNSQLRLLVAPGTLTSSMVASRVTALDSALNHPAP